MQIAGTGAAVYLAKLAVVFVCRRAVMHAYTVL
jgi:hypothetical protein